MPNYNDASITYDGFSLPYDLGPDVPVSYALTRGRLHIGKFNNAEAHYVISDQIIAHDHIEQSQQTPNVVMVDGEDDSWTEYDGGDLRTRGVSVNAYYDLPELRTGGDVRTRAVEELQASKRGSSPGGTVPWAPDYARMDHVFWVTRSGSKYDTRIEGFSVDFDQGQSPYQHMTVDTGVAILCLPDEVDTYLVRDLFQRTASDGLGKADIGGTWETYL
jgi:hypothetical protein